MKKIMLCAAAVAVGLFASCKKDVVTPEQDNNQVINDTAVVAPEVTPKQAAKTETVGLTCDNAYEINVDWPKENAADSITVDVVKEGKSEIFRMAKTETVNKYQSADGHFISKADTKYTFGQGDKTLCNCTEK
ncbi:hypothetical protein [Flavobacterium silvaticum]|uniref:C-type lysozyme inhibitor domain-containing protein n=1 Tax=Flavobacterium silvaticum TaxID=1852020 RepID=A0A972JKJ4_9FLAO|nr:hypothetical protein [Flavobacterium silvaticum]NMH29202.1 hypothetical protein [Flavobacterium silvaticum]